MPSNLAETQITDFERELQTVIKRLQMLIIKNAKSGYMFSLNAEERIKFALDLYDGLISAINESGYYDVVSKLIDQDKNLIAEIRSLRTAKKLPTTFTKTSKEVLAAFRNLEMAQFEDIGKSFASSLHQELMSFALTGVDEDVFIQTIFDKLDSGFQRYARTYAITSRAKFIQQVQDEAAKNYDGDLYWEYVGPEDDRMRDACIEGMAKRYFTDEERSQFEAETADERAWNCRHTFEQITKQDYEENTSAEGKERAETEQKEREESIAMSNLDPETKSAFEDLGITPKSSLDDVNKTFRGLAKLFHPDKGGTDSQMRIIIEARDKAINFIKSIKRGKI